MPRAVPWKYMAKMRTKSDTDVSYGEPKKTMVRETQNKKVCSGQIGRGKLFEQLMTEI